MTSMRQRAADGLKVGDRFTVQRCFSDSEIHAFAALSRDYNPVHCDPDYVALKGMRAPIAHGLLTASLMTEIGGQIGWLARSMAFDFKRPVYPGETLTCDWLIVDLDARGRARATIQVTNQDGVTVLEGQTSGVVPAAPERARLAQMIADGDPTNGAKLPSDTNTGA